MTPDGQIAIPFEIAAIRELFKVSPNLKIKA